MRANDRPLQKPAKLTFVRTVQKHLIKHLNNYYHSITTSHELSQNNCVIYCNSIMNWFQSEKKREWVGRTEGVPGWGGVDKREIAHRSVDLNNLRSKSRNKVSVGEPAEGSYRGRTHSVCVPCLVTCAPDQCRLSKRRSSDLLPPQWWSARLVRGDPRWPGAGLGSHAVHCTLSFF